MCIVSGRREKREEEGESEGEGKFSILGLFTDASGRESERMCGMMLLYFSVDGPSITLHPMPLSASQYTSATFQCTANANPLPAYQWLYNGQLIPGAQVKKREREREREKGRERERGERERERERGVIV